MRQILILAMTVFLASFSSCKKDSSDETTNPLIGTWTLESIIDNGVDKTTTDCDKKSTVVFTDKTATFRPFEISSSTGTCTEIEAHQFNYTYTGGKGSIPGDSGESGITFVIENGILVLTEVDGNSTVVYKYKKQ
ncbi:MAG: lipocalin family protein [Capnocytophaga sp.]|nr:lipocalin family protein [Capnocytophaga sp.]